MTQPPGRRRSARPGRRPLAAGQLVAPHPRPARGLLGDPGDVAAGGQPGLHRLAAGAVVVQGDRTAVVDGHVRQGPADRQVADHGTSDADGTAWACSHSGSRSLQGSW